MAGDYALYLTMHSSLDGGSSSEIPPQSRLTRSLASPNPAVMNTAARMAKMLTEALAPQSLDIVDESHKHDGHAGHRPGGETHFRVYIVSEAFKGKTRIERHRLINGILSAELAGSVHALAIHASAPGEG